MTPPQTVPLAECAAHDVGTGRSVQLLALEVDARGAETWHVSLCTAPGAAAQPGLMRHLRGASWDITVDRSRRCTTVELGSPDDVFRLACGLHTQVTPSVAQAAPHWPRALTDRLAQRRLSGAGTIAFDARWFLARLTTSAMDHPLLLLNAASALGLDGIAHAATVLDGVCDRDLPSMFLAALEAAHTAHPSLRWDGEGRLIGEHASGELAQLGEDLGAGVQAALGTGPLQVEFAPSEPLGLGLGPLRPPEPGADSVGVGAVVGEVEPQGAAARAGVQPGMVLSRLSQPDLRLASPGPARLSFEAVLAELDARRAGGQALTITFDTAAAVTHLYAVELPAAATLAAIAAVQGLQAMPALKVDLRALCGPALLWREATLRLFIGEAGSVTAAHTDICPQLQLAHGLLGVKLLGVASHAATARLRAEHADEEDLDEEATFVSTDRPLTPRQSRLLCDAAVSLLLLEPGDLAVFDSGALHFASNGTQGRSAAVYHGLMTPAALPRLRLAAARAEGSHSSADGAYGDHLFASDLLRIVEQRLRRHQKQSPPSRGTRRRG